MRKLILISIFIAIISQLFAQTDRFWVNGPGNWHDQMHWSLVSGGEAGADIPNANTNVYIDENSLIKSGDAIAIKQELSIKSFTISAPVTLKGNSTIAIYGSVSVSESTVLKKFKGDFVFASSGKQQINIPVELNSNMVFNGNNGDWNFQSDIISQKDIIIEKGNVKTNGKTIDARSFVSKGNSQRGLQLGNSDIKVSSWDLAFENNLKFDAGESQIVIAKNFESNFSPGDFTYNVVLPAASKAVVPIGDIDLTPTDATCPLNTFDPAHAPSSDYADGSVFVSVTLGVGTYTIELKQWNGVGYDNIDGPVSGNDVTFSNLESGSYWVFVSDGGEPTPKNIIVGPANLVIDFNVNSHITCPDGNDLSLTASPSGGSGTYSTYAWGSQIYGYTHNAATTPANLVFGDNYLVTVTDDNSCKADTNYYYLQIGNSLNDYLVSDGRPENISISGVTSTASCGGGANNGSISVATVSGGAGGYSYAAVLTGGSPVYIGTSTIPNLAPGIYDVWVRDANLCEKKYGSPVTVSETPAPTVSTLLDDDICETDNYAFSGVVVSNDNGILWTSDDGKGTFSDDEIANPTFTPHADHIAANTVDLTITVSGNGNCAAVFETMTLTINDNPSADLSVNATDICENADLLLDGNSSAGTGTITSHLWTGTGATYLNNTAIETPTFNSTNFGTYGLTYTATDDNGCSGSDNMTVTVQDGPSVNAGSNAEICEGENYIMPGGHASATNATVAWTENGTGSFTSGANTLTPTYTSGPGETGNVTFTLTATGIGTCNTTSVIDVMTLKINPLPVPGITGSNNVCLNATESYSTETGMSAYVWAIVDGTIDSGQGTNSVSVTWTGQGAPSISVSYTDNKSCGAAAPTVLNVTVNSNPSSDLSINGTSACQSTDFALDGNPSGGALPYSTHLWTGTGATHLNNTGSETPIFNSTATGSFGLTYKVTDANGCSGTDNMTITVNPGPTVEAGDDVSSCQDSPYTLPGGHASGSNGTFAWTENGLGSITAGANTLTPTYTPFAGETGDITLTLTVTGTGVCAASSVIDNLILTLNALPTPTITGDFNLCLNTSATYTTEAGMTGYTWNAVGGTITGGAGTNEVSIQWTAAGTQSVNVTYTDGNGCDPAVPSSENVTVHNTPAPDLSVNATDACQNTDLSLDGNPSGGSNVFISHLWTDAGAAFLDDTGIELPVFNCSTPGDYDLTYTVVDNNGCEGSDNMTITVNAGPTSDAGDDDNTCEGVAYLMAAGHATATNGNIAWTENGTGSITAGANTLTPTYTPGPGETGDVTMTITVTGTGACALASANDNMILTINPLPVPTILGNLTACLNTTAVYTTETGMSAYNWSVVGGTINSGTGTNEIEVLWTSTTTPSVSVNYTNANSCTAVAPTLLNVTVFDNPTADLSGNATTICMDNDLVLDGNPSGGSTVYTTHLWTDAGATYLDDINIQGPTFNCPSPGDYNLTYTVTDNNGCVGADNMTITVTDGPTAYAGEDVTLCYDAVNYTLSEALATNHSGVAWKNSTTGDISGFDFPTNLNPTYTLSDADRAAGFVTLTMTVSSLTCADVVDEMTITLAPELTASVGGLSPYLIDVATTQINVSFSLNHMDISQLGFYLVAPDGITEIELYRFNIIADGCNPLLASIPNTIDSLVFSLNSTGSSGPFNLCDFDGLGTINGEFDAKDSWNVFDGFDPAEGGWSLKIDDPYSGSSGTLTRATITFLDKNQQGNDQQILFDSKTIAYPIEDGFPTTYTVPIGLRTNCYGACDARAIVSVIGGTAPYVSYLWSDGQTGDVVDLCGGDHSVTVTDSRGCQSVGTVTVLEPDPIVIAFDSTNIDCFGDSTGMVKVTATEGAGGPYNYLWDDGEASTTAQVNNLPAGTYTVTVTDKNSCSKIGSVTITQPLSEISVSTIVIDSTGCNTATGVITVTATGGTPFTVGEPYLYEIDAVPTLNPITGLAVGTYVISIIDSLGCSLDTSITMVDVGDLEITGFTMLQGVACNGDCNGEVQVDFTGGTGTYSYAWTGGGLTGAAQALPNVCGDSTYTVLITDITTTCSTTDFYSIPQPDKLNVVKVDSTMVLCFGDSTGTADVIGQGGTAPYTYTWTNNTNDTIGTSASIINVPYGYVYINITDFNLCSVDDSIFIDQPTVLTALKDSSATRCGEATGKAVITPAGGTSPYTYLWDDLAGTTDSIANNLEVGIYNVTVSDFNGCQLFESYTIVDTSDMNVVVDSVHNVLCAGGNTGASFITVTDAVNPIDFIWSNGETTEDALMLEAGTHYATVTDANMCSRVIETVISQPDSLRVTQNIINDPLCFESATANAAVTPTGGVEPYEYLWPDGQTDSLAINLLAGTYIVTISDANGCDTTETVVLTDPAPITFEFEFKPTNCGDSVGTINVANIAGGTGVGTYNTDWASPEWASYPNADSLSVDTIRNLWVANYVAIVSDANGCIVRDSMNMQDTSSMEIILDEIINVSCNSGTNGSILIHGDKGKEPYTYLWNTGDADSFLNDVAAGSYSVIVEDAGQCRRDSVFTITEPDALVNQWVFTDSIVCAGKDSASFYALINGGVAPYTYLWENGLGISVGTDSNLVNAKPDTYKLTVVDANTCIYTEDINIFEPLPIALAITQGETTCPDSVGWAKVIASGGVAPYTYNWYLESNPLQIIEGQNTDSVSKLWVDVFVVQVTDSLGCVAYDTILIEDDSNLDFTVEILNHVSCVDKCDASAEIKNPVGGVQDGSAFGYTVAWGNGETTPIATNLCIGSTPVFIIDALGCKAVKSVEISNEDALDFTIQKLNDISQGDDACNGYAKADVRGGIEPYTYAWSKDTDPTIIGTTQTILDLCEGWYFVTVSDGSPLPACEVVDSVFIADDPLAYDTLLLQQVLCFGDSTGQVILQGRGGYPGAYNYEWSNANWGSYPLSDSTGSSISNLTAGRYYFTISDQGTSVINDSIDITQPDLYIPDFAVTETNCYDSSGVISINVAGSVGGTAPFTYQWANDNWSSNPLPDSTGVSIQNLHIGIYTAFITDANGCQVTGTVQMNDNSSFAINPAVDIPVRCYGFSNGSVYALPSNGTEPYTFNWDSGQTEDTIFSLAANTYSVTVMDADGCIRENSVELTQPDMITFILKDTVQNLCYTDCEGSVAVDTVLGGNYDVTDVWTYILTEDLEVIQEGSDSIFSNLCTGDYTIKVEDRLGCISDPFPFVFLSQSPQMIPSFEIIDSASCNNYSEDGKMAVEIEMGYFDQVSPTWVSEVITYNYQWDANPALTNDTLENAQAGPHLVLVTDNLGCVNNFTSRMPAKTSILLDSAYVLSSGLADDYLCPNDTIQLFAESTGYDSIVWNNQQYIVGDANKSLIEVVSRTTKIFYPTAYYKGCRDIDTVIVGRYTIDTLMATAEDDEDKIFAGNEIKLMANAPEVSYPELFSFDIEHKFTWTANHSMVEWNPSPPDSIAVFARPSETARFTVHDSIVITNETYSRQVCYLSDTLGIVVLPDFDPPKGFSPNGDGMFDEWELPGIDGYDNVSVQIYNRWGGLIWLQDGAYNANRWKGENSKGKPLPSGTYYYIIKYGDSDSGTKTLTGPITIVR